MHSISFKDQIQKIQTDIKNLLPFSFPFQGAKERLALDIQISKIAQSIRSSDLSQDERDELFKELEPERAKLIYNVPTNGVSNTFYVNLNQTGISPAPLCLAYNKMAVPSVSTYHQIGNNIAIIRLFPCAFPSLPENVQTMAGNPSDLEQQMEQVEIFWTAIDARGLKYKEHPLNLCTHPWAYPDMQIHSERSSDVLMGIAPLIGVHQTEEPGSIPFDGQLHPMNVHAHPNKHSMLYSPDNAHFRNTPDMPLSMFWAITKTADRIAITKMVLLFDYEHPICKALLQSIRDNDSLKAQPSLADHLDVLSNKMQEAIGQTFNPILDQFENDNPNALQTFRSLPGGFILGIHGEMWKLFGSPMGIHSDFGRCAFERDSNLDLKYHATKEQQVQAIRNYATTLYTLLVDSQKDLILHSQPLAVGDNVLRIMQCALSFFGDSGKDAENTKRELQEGIKQINALAEAKAIYATLASLKGPSTPFVDYQFDTIQAQAILQTAANQIDHWDAIPDNKPREEEVKGKEKITEESLASDNFFAHITIPSIKIEPSPKERVLGILLQWICDPAFEALSPKERSERVRALFQENIEVTLANLIYGKIYNDSNDKSKNEVWGWAEIHVADNLELLSQVAADLLLS